MKKGAPLVVLKREFDPDESFVEMVGALRDQLHTAKFGGGTNAVDSELKLTLMLPGFARRLVFVAYRWIEALGMFPKSFVDNDPLYASVFLTDLGSLGLDPVFHHLYEYGNVGTFGVLGRGARRAGRRPGHRPARAQAPGDHPVELRRAHRGRPVRGIRHQALQAARRGPGEGRDRAGRRRGPGRPRADGAAGAEQA